MSRVVYTIAVLVLVAACTRPTPTATADPPADKTTAVPTPSPTVAPESTHRPGLTSVTPSRPALDDGCEQAAPATWLEVGTSATIAMAQDPLVATIEAAPDTICSGGSTSVTVTVFNDGPGPVTIPTLRLMLGGNGMWKWDLAELAAAVVEAGRSVAVVTTATVPLVEPGEYRLFLYGHTGAANLSIAAPRGK